MLGGPLFLASGETRRGGGLGGGFLVATGKLLGDWS